MTAYFLRFTAPDPAAHAAELRNAEIRFNQDVKSHDIRRVLDSAGDLASLLTTANEEGAAFELARTYVVTAATHPELEESAWLLLAAATAAQYVGQRDLANTWFAEALQVVQARQWPHIEHYVLHHWGRSRAEEGLFDDAEAHFRAALMIRARLSDPRQASTQRALALLSEIRQRQTPESERTT